MKKILLPLSIIILLSLSACSRGTGNSQEAYDRANKASAESLKSLDRE